MPESSPNSFPASQGQLPEWDIEEVLALHRHLSAARGDFGTDLQLGLARMSQEMARTPGECISLFRHAGMLAAREARFQAIDINGWDDEPGEVIDGDSDALLQAHTIEPPKIEIFRITDYGDEPVTDRVIMRLVDTKKDWPEPTDMAR